MMRPRWRKVFHDLIGNLSRTALVVVSIAVGVFSIGVIVGAYVIISHDMSASYAANNPMNVELRTTPFDNNLVKTVQDDERGQAGRGTACVHHAGPHAGQRPVAAAQRGRHRQFRQSRRST